jgi:hypothetical protein
MVLKHGKFGKYIRSTWKVLKCGAAEGWRSVGPTVLRKKYYYRESRRTAIYYNNKTRKANLIGHILRRNCLLQRVIEGKIKGKDRSNKDEEEEVSSYWMAVRQRDDTGN